MAMSHSSGVAAFVENGEAVSAPNSVGFNESGHDKTSSHAKP